MALSFLSAAPERIFFLNQDLKKYLGISRPGDFQKRPNTL